MSTSSALPATGARSLTTLRAEMEMASDVSRVIRIHPVSSGEHRYLIETTHRSFPRYVIGRISRDGLTAHIEHSCGHYNTALDAWQRLMEEAP